LTCDKIKLNEAITLSLIISYYENGLSVYLTNEGFAEQLGNKVKFNTIKAIIPKLNRKGFISITQYKKIDPEYKKWKNTRIITITQKTIDIVNSEVQPLVVKTEQAPAETQTNVTLTDNQDIEIASILSVVEVEQLEVVNKIEEPIQKLMGEQKIDDAIDEMKKYYRNDEEFKKYVQYAKLNSVKGNELCYSRFLERIALHRSKFVKKNKPQVSV